MFHFIGILVVGLLVGIVAKFLTPGRDPGGCLLTIVLGIAGAFLASYVGQRMGWYAPGQPVGFFAAVVGAMIILLISRLFFGRGR